MPIRINQVHAKIGIESTRQKMEMQITKPKLELSQKHANITIHSELPKVIIDQSASFASSGLKSFKELTRELVELAYKNVIEYIGRTAEDGDILAAIENGGNPLADIAERNAYPEKEFIFTTIPDVGPKISMVDGYVWVDPGESLGIHNGVSGEFTYGRVNYTFNSASTNVYLRQKNSINFSFEPNKIDLYL